MIKNLLELFEEIIKEKKIFVNLNVDLDVSIFKFDKRILSVLLYALIENAVVYNKESGKIDINVERLKNEQMVRISITDSGFGISEFEQKKVFEKYFRGKKAIEIKSKGFGLGTYLSKKLTELLGGSIELSSKPNEGTTIFVRIPIK